MKQLGILCLCLLTMGFSTVATAQQIVEYSMYDEFGDIMFNAPGKLVKNGGYRSFKLDGDFQSDQDLSKYRYRTDASESTYNRTLNRESDVLTTYSNQRYKTNKVWKFRPLDEEKDKKIIKIEDEPAKQTNQGTMMQYRTPMMSPYSPMMMSPYMSPYMSPMMSPYTSPYMPMVPMMPGLVYPYMSY